jgi:hypothetical protein
MGFKRPEALEELGRLKRFLTLCRKALCEAA